MSSCERNSNVSRLEFGPSNEARRKETKMIQRIAMLEKMVD